MFPIDEGLLPDVYYRNYRVAVEEVKKETTDQRVHPPWAVYKKSRQEYHKGQIIDVWV